MATYSTYFPVDVFLIGVVHVNQRPKARELKESACPRATRYVRNSPENKLRAAQCRYVYTI